MLSLRDKALLVKAFYKNKEFAILVLRSYCNVHGVKKRKKKTDFSDRIEGYVKKKMRKCARWNIFKEKGNLLKTNR